jgi:hypothetical protein
MGLSLKRYVLVHYVNWLVAIGYFFCLLMVSVLVFGAIFKIDDSMKFTGVNAELVSYPIKVPTTSYIQDVLAKEGDEVEKGQVLIRTLAHPADVALIEASRDLEHARDLMKEKSIDNTLSSEMTTKLNETIDSLLSATDSDRVTELKSPISGVLHKGSAGSLNELKGKLTEGSVAFVYGRKSLKFKVPVGGRNSERVRINLLAVEDVSNWKELTRKIKGTDRASAPIEHVRKSLEGKLDEVKAGKSPLKRVKGELVAALNVILSSKDFYTVERWEGMNLSPEESKLIEKGIDNLSHTELVRLNRLLFQDVFPDSIVKSANEPQPVKAKIVIPLPETEMDEDKAPVTFEMMGTIVSEPEGGQVMVELPDPDPQIVDAILKSLASADVKKVTARGTVVVGRVSLFSFLFK